jgi:hypothetical protein
MRTRLIPLVLIASVGCKRETPPAQQQQRAAVAAAQSSLSGKILETFDASNYTYLRLQTANGEAWAAVPTAKVAVGQEVAVAGPIWMENFKSNTLNRSWEKIAFGTLEGGAPAAPKPAGPGMFAQAAAGSQAGLPPGHPPASAPADVGDVNVNKAKGAEGRRIAEIYAQRAALKDRRVIVRGKVVKATNGVMGKNWIHLRDGTGKDATADLTVATTDEAGVGQTVVVNGTVHLDRDLGAGYHYDVLIEDAQVKPE